MAHTYVPERQVEWWTSKQVERYFEDRGYACEALPLDQGIEKHVPADFVFQSKPPVKIFGFQYKVLYTNGIDHWRLDQVQHGQLQHFPWIYYALSEVSSADDRANALHALRIKKPSFEFSHALQRSTSFPYFRWWPFFQTLVSCRAGSVVDSVETLRSLLEPPNATLPDRFFEQVGSIFILDAERRVLLSFQAGPPDERRS